MRWLHFAYHHTDKKNNTRHFYKKAGVATKLYCQLLMYFKDRSLVDSLTYEEMMILLHLIKIEQGVITDG